MKFNFFTPSQLEHGKENEIFLKTPSLPSLISYHRGAYGYCKDERRNVMESYVQYP